jgi:Domain of unknown function (DUF4387)
VNSVGELADVVRSKNAGPFWVTLDVFCDDATRYARLAAADFVTPERVAALYQVPAESVQIHRLPTIGALKISFPRPVGQASPRDRDVHAGQQFVPLAGLTEPDRPSA